MYYSYIYYSMKIVVIRKGRICHSSAQQASLISSLNETLTTWEICYNFCWCKYLIGSWTYLIIFHTRS